MKKLFTFLFALIAGVGTICASDTQVNGIYYDFNYANRTASVTYRGDYPGSYDNEYSGAVTIPSSVSYDGITYSVTSIGFCAFYNCDNLTSVTIPNSVTTIGYSAFSSCSKLSSVHILDIAAWCQISFGNTSANPLICAHNLYLNGDIVTDLVIPNSVTSIGDYTFEYCTSLTSVTIPNGVTSIGNRAFSCCI